MTVDIDQINGLIGSEDYETAIAILEEQINENPTSLELHWYLGLAYLLQTDIGSAQEVWAIGINQAWEAGNFDGIFLLFSILAKEAKSKQELEQYELAWQIREQLQNLNPENLHNILHLIDLSYQLNKFSPEKLADWQILEILESREFLELLDENLLFKCVLIALEFPTALSIDLFEASIKHLSGSEWLPTIINLTDRMAEQHKLPNYAVDITKAYLRFDPGNYFVLNKLMVYAELANNHTTLLETGWRLYHNLEKIPQNLALECYVFSRFLMVLLKLNCWSDIQQTNIIQKFNSSLQKLTFQSNYPLDNFLAPRFWAIPFPLLYLSDNVAENRCFLNHTAKLFHCNFKLDLPNSPLLSSWENKTHKPLKVGYIGHTLRQHSVGWLSRWLFHHHNKQDFQLYFYLIAQESDQLTNEWIISNSYKTYNFGRDIKAITQQIQADNINILVDLDGLTSNVIAQVLSFKPAPIQVTWLGSDASGLPTIDYFIVDSQVVPIENQKYYQETLWYLPDTYLAIDDFEIGTMTLSRENLQIADDAIIYLCLQFNLKFNPDFCRLQLTIIKSVPNSVLLVKGASNNQSMQELFTTIATDIGLDKERIKFLPRDPDEMTHRANLAIADIVLDTYPYGGATTTLETLWLEIPLVTKVGQQFSARNSYAFMTSAGLTEGIAWSDQDYIDWGVRLGNDQKLRNQIRYKLHQSKKTAPIWNAKKFAREMETAYQQMWRNYLDT
jgi:predicted O-linked N-acetylglucosamine transferase (SPINDLY family)